MLASGSSSRLLARVAAFAALVAWLGAATAVLAQGPLPSTTPGEPRDPKALEGIGIEEHRGDRVPTDLAFFDQNGRRVTLADYLQPGRPVLLTLNYYRCPMLCGLVLNGVGNAVAGIDLELGKDYQVVTVGIDPAETPSLARGVQTSFAERLENPAVKDGWAFLTGEQPAIDAVAKATGFGFRWVEEQRQFAHPAVVMILTPDGTISRYLYPQGASGAQALNYNPETVRLSLVEASEGKIGSAMDQILLTCFHYDSEKGSYVFAMGAMRTGGALTVLVLVSVIVSFLVRERRARAHQTHALDPSGSAPEAPRSAH